MSLRSTNKMVPSVSGEDANDTWRTRSMLGVTPPVHPRKLAKVPFVELADGRLQGVVSSGSDLARVYVCTIRAGSHEFNCRTNNNRPCGGLRGRPCKHLESLLGEAVLQYGPERVVRYLRIDTDEPVTSGRDLCALLGGSHDPEPAAAVFSRFLHHLAYLQLDGRTDPLPEMHWFTMTRATS